VAQLPDQDLLASLVDTEFIYQNSPSGYLSILPDGTIIRLNHTLLNWLGYGEAEILYQKKFVDILSKGGGIHYEMFFRPMITVNGNIRELNYEILRKDHSSFPALISGQGIYDKSGKLQAVTLAITDITQRNLYEKELLKAKEQAKSEKERFENLAEMSPEMIWTINGEGQLTYYNQETVKYFRVSKKALSTHEIFSRIYPSDKIKLLRKWLVDDYVHAHFTIVLRILNTSLTYEWFKVNVIVPEKYTNDIKWFGTCSSINEHIKAMKRKDDFINMASHELKTPVTVLQSYLQLMQLYPVPDPVKEFLDKSLYTLKKFQFLISSLLNVTVINTGELTLNLSVFSLNNLLEFTIDQLRHTTSTHQLILTMEEKQILVKADMERISQVVTNIVGNAIKYSPAASSVEIKLNYNTATCRAHIQIIDFGVGIAPADINKIFERYYRAEVEKSKPGLGLGLYISQNILLQHASRLTVESEIGKGTTFSFSLPEYRQ
jgi:PAS domain S-box-containing protein